MVRCVSLLFATVAGIIFISDKGFETTSILAVIGYFLTAAIAFLLFLMYMKLSKCKVVIPGEKELAAAKERTAAKES